MNNYKNWTKADLEQYAADMETQYLRMRDQWRVELSFLAPALFLLGVAVGYIFFA